MGKNKKLLNKINSTALIIIVIGILTALNFFSYHIFYRFDLTRNKDYSLAEASQGAAAGLKDIVSVKAYFSADLPARYLNLRQEVGDLLDEYANYSGGKIKVEFIDPKDDPELKQELYLSGIPELQFNVLEKDKYQVVNGFLGILIKYGDKTQALPVVQTARDLEYKITSAIKKLTSDRPARIGFWQSNGAAGAQNGVSAAHEKLGEIYDVTAVDLAVNKNIPDDLDTLIIIGPVEKFSDNELKALDEFLLRGGSLVILADGVTVEPGLAAVKNDIGLNKLLEAYGLKLNNNLILDASSGLASFSQGFVTFTVDYPYWPKVINSGFDQNNPAVSGLETLVMPWSSSIDVDLDKTGDLAVSYLARSTDNAAAAADNFNLSPQTPVSGASPGRFNLAVSLSGNFSGSFGGQSTKAGRLILVGDSDFIKDNILRSYPDNLLFFQNAIDGLSLGGDLIAIRSKGAVDRPLKETSETVKAVIRYGNIFGLTAIVLLFGLIRYYLRRRPEFNDGIDN
ncbi:MAG: GldG family protein [bacterium]|nr:GldG family protein [bacterium]